MGTPQSTGASLAWNLGQYDSPQGLGLPEPVAFLMVINTGTLSYLTHRPAAADQGTN